MIRVGAPSEAEMKSHRIIDPAKVVRLALENAVSVAGVLLLTDATMTDVPDPNPQDRVPAEAGL